MTQITGKTLTTFRSQIQDELKALGDRLGIDFKLGHGTYDASGVSGSLKLELSVRETASGKSGAQVKFERDAFMYDLTGADFEREFGHSGQRFKLIGFNHKSPKYCLSIKSVSNGSIYKLDLDSYKAAVLYEDSQKKAA